MGDLLYGWLGDDFTGSTDVLEVLAEAGVPAVLLLRPDAEQGLARFPGIRAVGLASDARSQPPAWMDRHLPGLLGHLAALSPAVLHYKTCSTFDSAPDRGSIGRAIEWGLDLVGGPAPIVVGAPELGRYLLFSTLFAKGGEDVWRLDRHPTMAHHPATPMNEADLRRHLAHQTALPISAITLPQLQAGQGDRLLAEAPRRGAVMIDSVDQPSLAMTGAAVWHAAQERPLFAAGSSGLTSALITAWREAGLIGNGAAPSLPAPAPVDRLLVVSGSCSPATAAQIDHALTKGYVGLELRPHMDENDVASAVAAACAALNEGRHCVLYTARGPLSRDGQRQAVAGEKLGAALGDIIGGVVGQTGIGRVLLAGGDTSSHAVARMGLDALTWAGRLERGAPLCRVHGRRMDGLELVLKGGQIGAPDFFETVRRGRG